MKPIKQHDITDCGPACLASIFSHYGLEVSISKIRSKASTNRKGTNLFGLVRASESFGFTARGIKTDPSYLKELQNPVIAHVIRNSLQHFVVVYGYEENRLQIMDPADGKIHKSTVTDFIRQWTGVLLIVEKSENFIPTSQKKSRIERYVQILKPHRKKMILAMMLSVLYTVIGLSTALYLQIIIDYVIPSGLVPFLLMVSAFMLFLMVLQITFNYLKSILMLQTGKAIDQHLMSYYLSTVFKLPQSFFDNMRQGEIISRFGDAMKIRAFISDISLNLFINALVLIAAFGLMISTNWKLGLLMITALPLYGAILFLINRSNTIIQRKVMEHAAELESQMIESISKIESVKLYNKVESHTSSINSQIDKTLSVVLKSGKLGLLSQLSTSIVNGLYVIALVTVGALLIFSEDLSLGSLMAFYALMAYFTAPVSSLIKSNQSYQDAIIATQRLFDIIDLYEVEKTVQTKLKSWADISFQDVKFRYGAQELVLDGLSMKLPKSSISCIIGESGSGKSTIANILTRMYPYEDGLIKIGDSNLAEIETNSLRVKCSIVPQRVQILSGTILENITLNEIDPDKERVVQILKQIGLSDFVDHLPFGLESQLGEMGLNLSGGQQQLIAFARAIYHDPDCLILDEATSALDPEHESKIIKVLQTLKEKGKTIIIISHKMKTNLLADKIFVLADGKIIEEGTHQELFKMGTAYHSFWEKHNEFRQTA